MRRLALYVGLAAMSLLFASPTSAIGQPQLRQGLAGFWTYVLQTPASQNPFTTDNNRCLELGREALAPLLPFAPATTTCTVKTGTRVFVGEMSAECSTAESPPFHGSTEAQLRECVRNVLADFSEHKLVVDDRTVPVRDVETRVLAVKLPPDNMLGVPTQEALSVARGWVALLPPMTPGTHRLTYTFAGSLLGQHLAVTNHITIIVTPRGSSRSSR